MAPHHSCCQPHKTVHTAPPAPPVGFHSPSLLTQQQLLLHLAALHACCLWKLSTQGAQHMVGAANRPPFQPAVCGLAKRTHKVGQADTQPTSAQPTPSSCMTPAGPPPSSQHRPPFTAPTKPPPQIHCCSARDRCSKHAPPCVAPLRSADLARASALTRIWRSAQSACS